MAESPTRDEVLTERPDLQDIIRQNEANLDVDDYVAKGLAHVKRDLRERKSIKWDMVYDSDSSDYYTDSEGDANNKDTIINMIILMTIALAFKDYSIAVEDSAYWDLYLAYRQDYDAAMTQAKLDVDWNESGGITTDEEATTTQVYFRA